MKTVATRQFLPSSLIVVKNLDEVITFFESLFSCDKTLTQVPCRYASLQLSPNSSIVLVESGSCDEEMKQAFGSISVRQLFIQDANIREIQRRALQIGAVLNESNINGKVGDKCVVEGPEGIVVHVFSLDAKLGMNPTDILMKSLLDKVEQPEESRSITHKVNNRVAVRRPQIKTVDVVVQSDYHPLGVAPCPPNSTAATPFETEV